MNSHIVILYPTMLLYPAILSVLSTIVIILASICIRRIYWARKEKKRLIKLGKRFDRYILKNGDTYLDTNNIPEWFARYNRFKIHKEAEKINDSECNISWDHSSEPIGKVIAKVVSSTGVCFEVELDTTNKTPEEIEDLKIKIQREGFLDE